MTMTALRDLTVVHHNVRNWTNNRITLGNIYNQLDADIITINEHCLTDDRPLKLFNYNTFSINRQNEHHSGAAIAIKKGLTYRLHDDFYSDMIAITIQTRQGPITIGTAYIPPRRNYINLIDLNRLLAMTNPTYIFADMNAKHRCLGHTTQNNRGLNIHSLMTQDKCRHIGPNFPTFISHNGTTSPDIVLTNRLTFHNILLTPGPITPSDHIPIIAKISINPIQIPIKPRLHYYKADWDTYKDALRDIDVPTEPTPTLEEIDRYLTDWTNHVKQASAIAIPKISYRIIPGIKPNHTTLTIQTQYNDLLNDITTAGPSRLKLRQLTALRHRLTNEYRHQYSITWNKIIDNINIQANPRLFWRSIRRMTGTNDKQKTPYLKHNGNKLDTPDEKEPIFREHWRQIYSGIDDEDNDFDEDHTARIEDEMTEYTDLLSPFDTGDLTRLNEETFPPITMDELNQTIKQTKQRAPGPTTITSLQLKHLPINMKQYLLYIFNQSISAGYFPDTLKHAIMIFLPKPATSQYNVKNYRPISLLDTHSKILDKILNTRLNNILTTLNKHNPRQHGFRPYRGTHTAIATIHEAIARNVAQKNKIDIVLRDVSKAFDKVWHTGLKYKIIQLHLHPCFTKTLIDYITDRTATIRIGNHIGPSFPLNSGVPQGACLSPTLYSFFVHDCPPPIPDTDYVAYADDITQIIAIRGNPTVVANNTTHAIEQINNYENKWKIKTNTTKFQIIPISRYKTSDIFINNRLIPYSHRGKVLGLNFSTFGFTQQPKIRKAIAATNMNKLIRFHNLSPANKRKLYISLVRSVLTYPIIPLHTVSKTQMLSLQRIQNRATRFITNTSLIDRVSSEHLHDIANLPPINIFLSESAKTLWQRIELTEPDLYHQLTFPHHLVPHQQARFLSSFHAAQQPLPEPIYS